MESAELSKKKRVKHCYPRREVYHRFVHDNTLVYNNDNNFMWGMYDWLFVGHAYNPSIKKSKSKEDLYEDYKYNNGSLIAVIDRDNKRIVINKKYAKHWWDLKNAVPDNWEIFLTNKTITSLDIFNNEEELYKLHITYLIENIVNIYLTCFYKVLNTNSNILNVDIDKFKENLTYKQIISFIKKYKLYKYDWAKSSLNEKFKVSFNCREWWKKSEIALPTINQFYKGTIFNKKQLLRLKQCYFYTKYCYGNGIPFKDVVENWNKEVHVDKITTYLRKHNNYCDLNNIEGCSWNDYIAKAIEADRQYILNIRKENIEKSNENENKAREELAKLCNVNDWRESKYNKVEVTFKKYIPYRKGYSNKWIDVKLTANNQFNNVQLKLSKDGKKRIETSKGASVPYDAAKELWRRFIIWTNSNNVAENPIFNFESKNITVGIYKLRFIRYCTKCTDAGKTIYSETGKSTLDWLIQIGCHSIWLTDVLDFINYYKLNKDFPTQYAINPRVKPNINNI